MLIRMIEQKDAAEAVKLILEGYDRFMARDYSPGGAAHFRAYAEALPERISSENHFALVAVDDGELVGIIELRDCHHCTLFFVKARFHGQGIGRWLFEEAVAHARAKVPHLSSVEVHSSPYAVPVYRKLGFKNTDTLQDSDGIIYQPMVRKL